MMAEWLLLQHGNFIYVLLFLLLMGGSIGLPIPEDIPLLLAGVLYQADRAKPQILFLVCYGAIILGDMIIFAIGRSLGLTIFQKQWFKKRVPQSKIRSVRFGLEKRSLLTILLARHLFYLRTVTFLICGAVRMKWSRFLIADAVAALVSVPLMMGIGYFAAEHYDKVSKLLGQAKAISIFVCLALALVWYVYSRRKKDRNVTEEK